MTTRLKRTLPGLLCSLLAFAAGAEGRTYHIPTRDGVTTSLYWHGAANAKATVLLFPGGGGGFGKVEDGRPQSNNFLVRSLPHFLANGLNVAIFGRPGDRQELDYADRIGEVHLTDVRQVLAFVRSQSAGPLWIVGTSRGTISATAVAIDQQDSIAGLVLTASVVNYKKTGAVPRQNLAAIRIPVLVLHHARDACELCRPHEVPAILRGLTQAAIKKEIFVSGGANPTGDPCAALHWHGFIGMEAEAVGMIAEWIAAPGE